MEEIVLAAEKREEKGRHMRKKEGVRIPAVVYGHGFETQNVWVDMTLFNRTFEKAGTNTIISLTVDGGKSLKALIHDYQTHPLTDQITHIDFFHVRMDEKVETSISLVIAGESAAVKNMGGTLNHTESIPVRALPGDLLHEVTIDITGIATFDDRILVADLNLGDKIEILIDAQTPIVSVIAPRTQAEVDAADEEVDADVSKVESTTEKDADADTDEEGKTQEK